MIGFFLSGSAQELNVTGKIVSTDTGEPLIGASVIIKNTFTGTTTDLDGNYSISAAVGDVLVYSYTGFTTMEKTVVAGQTTMDVSLATGLQLDEVVVTALGISRDKKALGYSVQEVNAEELTGTQENNVINALQGKVAGVQINSSSGAPGAGSSIVIRGLNSLNPGSNNQPLFVVDGIPIGNQTFSGSQLPSSGSNAVNSQEQSSFTNRAADLNPADIASVSILKGAAATALYGLRAANGVVVITTKKGQAGKTNVSFNSTYGWEEINKSPDLVSTHREGRHGRLRFNSDGSPLRFQTYGPKVYEGLTPVFDLTDDFFQTGSQFKNSISIQGGNDRATYLTSFSRLDHTGIIPFTEWDRTTVRIGGEVKVSDPLTVSGSVNYSKSGGNKPHAGDKSILSSLGYYTTSFDVNDYINPDGSQRDFSDGIIDNPRYLAEFSKLSDDVNRVIGNIGFNYQPLPWLELDYKLGNDFYNDSRVRSVPDGTDVGSQVGGFIIEEQINYSEITSNLYLRASKQLTPDFTGSLTVGNNITDIKFSSINTRGEGFSLENFYDLSNTSNVFASKNASRQRLVGLFGIASFGFKDYLYLDLTARNDWSSTLPVENRSFFYPSASLSWVVSEMTDLPDFFTFLKLRGSWAQVGKDAGPYQIGIFYSGASNFPFNGVNGFSQSSVAGDFNLKPETTTSTEFGLDLRVLQNRIGIDFTYFKQNSKDQIIPVPVSNATGYSRFITNAGEIENSGVELLLNLNPVSTKDFSWDMSINYSKMTSKVISIKEGIDEIIFFDDRITSKLVPGGKVGDLYGWDFDRSEDGQLLIGSNGFPQINFDSTILVGNAYPDFTAGMTNTFTYKGLSLGFLLEWRSGGDVYDRGFRNSLRNGLLAETERRHEEVIFDGVLADGSPNNIPVEINGESLYRDGNRYNNAYQILLQDASWFRVRRVSLGYSLPSKMLNKQYISSARISFSGNNLFLSTPARGYDPEINYFGSGSNIAGYTGLQTPATRSYFVSLDLNF
ncbi:SusC/RagA family TonB-linked outer membrane protein [Portibacter lacus]|uniref:SusC/RagA family TonB-linked outer membrane protein n=2 Tax=Portibacter lacus TaxID=1099794 RepID=A0AA37SJE8_9BACT|nr:SusC/RagA family TonB-linked outer membrane protein [Portibacter lacus]